MHGVINLLKPPGMTSHDAVSFVRPSLKIKRVGHTGTLDPAAAGVLPICVGQTTRLVEYLQAGRKSYIAEATFGYETDTLDGVGETTREADASGVTLEAVRTALVAFRGEINQIPPAFSAIKQDGQKLYDLARAGQVDESALTPRRVTIHQVVSTHFTPDAVRPRAMIQVDCSSGTYIRSLVRDLGRALGCGATMTFLVRTSSGMFGIDEAATLEEIAANPSGTLLALQDVLKQLGWPLAVSNEAAHDFSQGRRVAAERLTFSNEIKQNDSAALNDKATGDEAAHPPMVVVRNEAGNIAVLAVPEDASNDGKGQWYKAEKVLFLDS